MLLKGIIDEDFVNYKLPSMFIACHSCTFKCGSDICQNSSLALSPDIDVDIQSLVQRYLQNPITSAVVFGGLEPFDDIENVLSFIYRLRNNNCKDDVVIYTGYTEDEVKTQFKKYYHKLKKAVLIYEGNIIIKYGRFIPNCNSHFDTTLGVNLSSPNQYAKKIGEEIK